MKILYAASEALPYASTGGLADVVGSLPKAVKSQLGRDSDIRVVIPLYPQIREKYARELDLVREITVRLAWRNLYCGIWKIESDGVVFYFIDNQYYFDRNMLYGNFDDGERFAFFSKCILELMSAVGFYPDILHANDWQTALSVVYLKRKYSYLDEYRNISALFTIHNIDYQGVFDFNILGDIFELPEWDRNIVDYNGNINLLKGALVCADMVNTVSLTYSREILTEYYSGGLHYVLRTKNDEGRLTGIVNGIDIGYYNPETDPDISANYSVRDTAGKAKNKEELQMICGLDVNPDTPVITMVSRLAGHKGFDLVKCVLEEIIANNNVQFVILGTGEYEYEDYFRYLSAKYPSRVAARFEYNKALSKKFYAGADIFLMPSKSEPCGLSQMIACRYGTVPLVRECGGLADTIRAYNEYDGSGNGFSFRNYNAHEMMTVIRNAIETYKNKDQWNRIMNSAMNTDFSWNASACKYIEIYNSIKK